MAISKSVSMGSIVTGCSLLVLTSISVICGGVVMSRLTKNAAFVSVGLWGLYFAVPGVLSIVSGFKKQSSLLAVSLGPHILGVFLAIAGLSSGFIFWDLLKTCIGHGDDCNSCSKYKEYSSVSCSDMKTIRNGTAAVTVIFAFFTVFTFVGSIYGSIGACCAPQIPAMMVTTAEPDTVVMTTQSYPAYKELPPPYNQGLVNVDTKARH